MSNRTVKDALTEYLVDATKGNAEAQYKLAECYDDGLGGLEQNQGEAFRWYEKSASQGYPNALYALAYHYQYGKIVEKDEKKALNLYIEAAKKGCIDACFCLAWIYKNGSIVDVDYDKAFHYASLAAAANDASAKGLLGSFYENGIGTEVNYTKALEWYRQAVDNGAVYYFTSIGWLYENGLGVAIDRQKAFEMYKKAAEHDEVGGYFYLGMWYHYKDSDDDSDEYLNDWKEAFKYYKLAAELAVKKEEYEYTESFVSLAEMYENGWGTDKDIDRAIKWYTIASEHDCEEAIEKLENLTTILSNQTYSTGLLDNEQEYLEEYKLCIEEDGEISPKERRLLDRLREKLGISISRAIEIEKSYQ